MNAADVLAEARLNWAGDTTGRGQEAAAKYQLAALLAHGEQGQGVTIEADGEMHPKDPPPTLTEDEAGEVLSAEAEETEA
jgi:hypothetical protein